MNDTPPPDGTDADTRTVPPPREGEGPRVSSAEMRDLARIRRSSTDRKIAGVAGGLARHFDIDPLIVRVALVVLVFFGGGGILLYGAAWLLVPDDRGDAVVSLDDRSRTVALAVVGALAALSVVGDAFGGWTIPWPLAIAAIVVVVVLASSRRHGPRAWHHWTGHGWHGPQTMHGWQGAGAEGDAAPYDQTGGAQTYPGYEPFRSGPPRDPRKKGPVLFGFALGLAALAVGVVGTIDLAGVDVTPSAYPAVAMAAFGLMLLVGAFYGRAGGLIFLGLVAAVATLGTSLAGQVDLAMGQIRHTPTTAASLDDRYSLFAGEIVIDLREVKDLESLDDLELDATFGHIKVIVPDQGLTVNVDAGIEGGGEVNIFGDRSSESQKASYDGGDDAPTIDIQADLVFGEIEFIDGSAA